MALSLDQSLETLLGKQLRSARRRAAAVTLFQAVLNDEVGRAFLALLECLDRRPAESAPKEGAPNGAGGSAATATYARVFAALATEAAIALPGTDAWQSHLLWRIIDDRNPLSILAERSGAQSLPVSLLDQARRDLRGLQWLYALTTSTVREALTRVAGPERADALAAWDELAPERAEDGPRARLACRLGAALDWGAMAEDLADHWHTHGLGLFSRCLAARWNPRAGTLEAQWHVDPVRLEALVAYDEERAPLLRNTERFVAGYPAHHCLIYGERGTGKSSTVKALLQAYEQLGLRLVELDKDHLADMTRVLALLRDHPQRFLLFVDDLSFEEQETEYKALKSALEGRIEAWPANVLLYVTTNRRHLVKERFADRETADEGEIRPRDTMEEKLSLADRFGLQVAFPSPDQNRYVAVATALARAQGITMAEDELRRRAIKWALWHNGRSCRTARQFVDDLIGEM